MDYEQLIHDVWKAHLTLVKSNLVIFGPGFSEGNASAITDDRQMIIIKSSGVDYENMDANSLVIVNPEGTKIAGKLKPSVDTPIHLEIYKQFPHIKGIVHTHSKYATIFAQLQRDIPCFGTTHADAFGGPIPVCRFLAPDEVYNEYERNTGKIICDTYRANPHVPAVLVPGHAPFVFGNSLHDAVNNAIILEKIAHMSFKMLLPHQRVPVQPVPQYLIDFHFKRKHGPNSYYGQKTSA